MIGAGLAGLSAGASLAAAGRQVLVSERAAEPGGCASELAVGDHRLRLAFQLTSVGHDRFLPAYLESLGQASDALVATGDTAFVVDFAGERIVLAGGVEAFTASLVARFPDARPGIFAFLECCRRVASEVWLRDRLAHGLPSGSMRHIEHLAEMGKQYPTLFRSGMATVQAILDQLVDHRQAGSVLGALWPHMGVPPRQLSLVQYATVLLPLLDYGPLRPDADAHVMRGLVQALERAGGELVVGTEVEAIVVNQGRVAGVIVGSELLETPIVIAAMDATHAFTKLLDPADLPSRYLRRLMRMAPSPSALIVASLAGGVAWPPVTFLFDDWDYDIVANALQEGRPAAVYVGSVPLANGGAARAAVLPVTPPAALDLEDLADELTARVERVSPGFANGVIGTITPADIEAATGSRGGALTGWAEIPSQIPPRRLATTTPIEGLYLAGHWSQPGGGVLRAVYSGLRATTTILGYMSPLRLLDDLAAGTVRPKPMTP